MAGGPGAKPPFSRQIAAQSAGISSGGSKSGLNPVQKLAVELYGRGLKKTEVLNHLVDHIAPKKHPEEDDADQRKRARVILRKWERSQEFRDALFQGAVTDTDLASKDILRGITARAKEGSVDAAKFALEVAGRYTPRGEPTPPVVTVNFGYLPRPDHRADHAAIDVEAEELPEA